MITLAVTDDEATAKTLGFPTITREGFEGHPEDFNKSLVIRWGNSRRYYNRRGVRQEFKNVANPSVAIRLNCMKQEARATFSEVVNVPKKYENTVPRGKMAVVRPLSHEAGIDFQIVTGPYVIPWGYYTSEFVETDTEYRVWFAHDRTFAGQRVPIHGESRVRPCRSKWAYSYRDVPAKLHKDTLAAAKAIGLNFGAADVLIKGGKYYFLELNSGVSVDAPTPRRFFQEAIEAYAASRGFRT